MNIHPLLQLGLTMHRNPGVYALLLGSGLSRAAGIPTGWEIVLDLIKQVAQLESAETGPRPEQWWQDRFGEPPLYSKLLKELAKTPAQRSSLLRPYFEPTDLEKEQGIKQPTKAHKAIAQLVRDGYIRMILSTNFDRLLEIALEKEGVVPNLVSTEDDFKGAQAYVHANVTIIKLHGDYRDARIRNTEDELSKYSRVMDKFLNRVFDDFGLIVCGWSGEWDIALKSAILRAPNRRYGTYWLSKGEATATAKDIIANRKAERIDIIDADDCFTQLVEHVQSLRTYLSTDPLPAAVAVETVKRYIVEPRHCIRLHDLVRDETTLVLDGIPETRFETTQKGSIGDQYKLEFQENMRRYEALTNKLASIIAALSYHDEGPNDHLIVSIVERVANVDRTLGDDENFLNLRRYPALLIIYSAGIAALAAKKYHNLATGILTPKIHRPQDKSLIELINHKELFPTGSTRQSIVRSADDNTYTPPSNHLYDVFRPILSAYIPEEATYEATFDTFEYILSLQHFHVTDHSRYLLGRFVWRYNRHNCDQPKEAPYRFIDDGITHGDDWGLLKAGFFDGSAGQLQKVRNIHFDKFKDIELHML